MRALPHTVLGAEVILESYAEVYSNQFMTGNSPLQLVQWSTVPNKKKISIWYPSLITRNSSRARQPLSRVNVTELLRRLLVKIENIYLFKIIIIIIINMETSLKTGFAQIFSCCPKNLRCPNFAPPRSVRLWEFIPANYFGVILSWLEFPNIPNCFLNTSKCCRKCPKMFWWFSEDFQTFSHDILQTLAQWPQHSRPQSINVSDSASKELSSLPGRHA